MILQNAGGKCYVCHAPLKKYNPLGSYCPVCYSVFCDKTPTEKELSEFYGNYNSYYHGGGRDQGAGRRQNAYAVTYLNQIKSFFEKGTLIDIGTATNPLPNLTANAGFDTTIVDFTKPEKLDEKVEFIPGTLENLDLQERTFDVVTALAVVEHLRDPVLGIGKLAKLCKPGGIIIIMVPRIGGKLSKYQAGISGWFYPPEHLNLLSTKFISEIMKMNGASLKKERRLDFNMIRYTARYGIGFLEGLAGFLLYGISKKLWNKVRNKRSSKYVGMTLMLFTKEK